MPPRKLWYLQVEGNAILMKMSHSKGIGVKLGDTGNMDLGAVLQLGVYDNHTLKGS